MMVIQTALLFLSIIIAAGLAYLYLLLIAGKPRAAVHAASPDGPPLRFAVAIPAHNEAGVIAALCGVCRR